MDSEIRSNLIFQKRVRIVSSPHFVYNFSRIMFLKLYSIKSPNLIA